MPRITQTHEQLDHAKAIVTSEQRYEIAKALARARASVTLAHIYLDRCDEIGKEVRP